MQIIDRKHPLDYLLFFLVLTALLGLGVWQLVRGLEKLSISRMSESIKSAPLVLTEPPVDWQEVNYQLVTIAGKWLPEVTMLLENRQYQGRPGFEVLTPFKLAESHSAILVNRGWQEKITAGSSEIEISAPDSDGLVTGQLYLPEKGFTLGPTYSGEVEWPLHVLYYDFQALSDASKLNLVPAVVVLPEGNPNSFKRIWQPATISPARHFGYVAQWWGLAVTLIIFGLIWRKKSISS